MSTRCTRAEELSPPSEHDQLVWVTERLIKVEADAEALAEALREAKAAYAKAEDAYHAENDALVADAEALAEALEKIERQMGPRNKGGVIYQMREMKQIARDALAEWRKS